MSHSLAMVNRLRLCISLFLAILFLHGIVAQESNPELRPRPPAWEDHSATLGILAQESDRKPPPRIPLREDHSDTLSRLEQQLSAEHARYQSQHYSRLQSMDTHPSTYNELSARMREFYTALSISPAQDMPLHLSNINELRRDGYRFSPQVDPGLHVAFGTRWNHRIWGPYPATRLAQGGFKQGVDKLQIELENAKQALDRQSLLDVGGMGMGHYRGLMAYTDDFVLLKSAIDYHEHRLAEELENTGKRMTKVMRVA